VCLLEFFVLFFFVKLESTLCFVCFVYVEVCLCCSLVLLFGGWLAWFVCWWGLCVLVCFYYFVFFVLDLVVFFVLVFCFLVVVWFDGLVVVGGVFCLGLCVGWLLQWFCGWGVVFCLLFL